jgi:SAM-dependent methyltransferase
MQALDPGWNVLRDVERYHVSPHQYDDQMLQLYKDGDGFIFETMVFWAKPFRFQWTMDALNRIQQYAGREGRTLDELRILIFGDGSGNDSLFFASKSLKVDYFDVPGSKTFEFATRRFQHYGCLGRSIEVLSDYSSCFRQPYDAVISFEVLEHLIDPEQTIADIAAMLKRGGIALITEDFEEIIDRLPTHLQKNTKFIGQLPFLFLKNNMCLTWYKREPIFKPFEFTKVDLVSRMDRLHLLRDPMVRGSAVSKYIKRIFRKIEKASFYGG